MNMNWWQSLLIAIIPALITAGISMLVSLKQLKRAREEIEEKYRAENKLYVDKAAFDNEYSIFRELCEKTFTMVSDTISNLFPSTLVFKSNVPAREREFNIDTYKMCQGSFNEAHKAISKYACFISKKWYNQFVEIKTQCAIQLRCFYYCKLVCPSDDGLDLSECYKRTTVIESKAEKLMDELRQYISSLTHKEETNNGD